VWFGIFKRHLLPVNIYEFIVAVMENLVSFVATRAYWMVS
jgi:hypothetical protein